MKTIKTQAVNMFSYAPKEDENRISSLSKGPAGRAAAGRRGLGDLPPSPLAQLLHFSAHLGSKRQKRA